MQLQPEHRGGRGLSLWATDIASAYTKLFFKSSDVKYIVVELIDGLILFFLAGIFGWGSTPACFAVISRLLLFEFRQALSGESEIYVDDASGCCAAVDVSSNLAKVDEIVCRVLGPGALAHSKTRHGRRLDLIGYTLDLDTQCVSIAPHNVLRAIYGFFKVGENGATIKVNELERLASWASRYGVVCVNMLPFTSKLYAAYAGRNRNSSVELSEELWRICRLFQALLVLSVLDENRYARSFRSSNLALCPCTAAIEFDASLFGGGGLIFTIMDGVETLIGGFRIDLLPLGFGGDAQYQNCAEFITAVIGIRIAHKLNVDTNSVLLRGDSVTALQWAESERFRSTRVTQAACVFVFETTVYGIENVKAVHLPKESNTRCDDLSRGVSWERMQQKYPELRTVPLIDSDAVELITLCDPKREFCSDDDLATQWGRFFALL
jgi:hypothetical protein